MTCTGDGLGLKHFLKSVTCTAGHPLEVIGKGMNEGNSWFTFSGYMDFLAQKEITDWLARVNLPVVADVGTIWIIFPLITIRQYTDADNYDGLQVQEHVHY